MRQKNLPSSKTTNLKRCWRDRVLHEKKQIKTIERACASVFSSQRFSPNFFLFANNGRGNPPPFPPSQYVCLPATPMYYEPSLSYFWMRKQMIDEI